MSVANKLLQHTSDDLTITPPNDPAVGIALPPPGSSVIFDTTAQSLAGFVTLNGSLYGQSFTTGGTSTDLSDLKLDLSVAVPSDGGTVSVELWSDAGGINGPGIELTTLATIDDSQLTQGVTLDDISLNNNPTLAANTRYWIVLQGDGNTSAYWGFTSDLSGTEASTELNDGDGSINTDIGDNQALQMSVTTSTCFAEGTRILTAAGELPVESLQPGDEVMALRRGGLATVRWIGCRPVNLRRHPNRARLDPVRIQQNAFAPGVPRRDLFVSPDHALYIDGGLVTVRYLLNGASIAQTTPDEITYYHIELDSHDVVLAENLPAESFLDIGNRAAFANGGTNIMAHPEFSRETWDARACAPGLVTPEQRAPIRARLRARLAELGYAATEDADLRIEAGLAILRPSVTGNIAEITLPAGTEEIRLLSRTACPVHTGPEHADGRCLGIGVRRVILDGQDLPLDDPNLSAGWHAPETNLRWTAGAATLRTHGATRVSLHLLPGLTYWCTVQPAELAMAA
jgi:hypothetical protein